MAGPVAVAADDGHSQMQHMAASNTAYKAAVAPTSTASKLRSGCISTNTMFQSASLLAVLAGSKRCPPTTDQPHPPAAETIASKPKKQRTCATDVSTTSKPVTVSTQAGAVPDGASKQAVLSKAGLHVKPGQHREVVDLTSPPISASAASAPDTQPEAVKQEQPAIHQPTHRAQAMPQQTKHPHRFTHTTANAVSSSPATDVFDAGYDQTDIMGDHAAASEYVATRIDKEAAVEDGAHASAVSKTRLNTRQLMLRGRRRRPMCSRAEAYQYFHQTQGGKPAASAAAGDERASSDDNAAASDSGTAPSNEDAAVVGDAAAALRDHTTASADDAPASSPVPVCEDLADALVVPKPKPRAQTGVPAQSRRRRPTRADFYQSLHRNQAPAPAASSTSSKQPACPANRGVQS